jgi:hypothetical protein
MTPTATPTHIPRTVEPEAQTFHARAEQFGLPTPFVLWPVAEPDLYQNGYGPNGFAFQENCATPPAPPATPDPSGAPTPVPTDRCPYRGVNSIHPGVDYFNGVDRLSPPVPSVVVALCDGIIVPGRSSSGGSARPTTGDGLSLRCFANDPADPDGNNLQNLSNIVVVYNHLTLDQGISRGALATAYPIVTAGDEIATTTGYDSPNGYVQPHLDLQVYVAYGYQSGEWAIQLNPRLMFTYPPAGTEAVQPFAPNYDQWSLQGRRETSGTGSIHFWTNTDNPIFIRDMTQYLEAVLLPGGTHYIGPNCTNVTIGSSYPADCTLDRNDLNVTPTPTQSAP